ncbi:MAG: hypothetical protein WBD86_02280 [Microgenomates group bacterium]
MTEKPEQPQTVNETQNWASGIPSRAARLLSENLQEIPGFEKKQVLTGHIINRVLADDVGCFHSAVMALDWKAKRPDQALGSKQDFIERMEWEEEQTVTPDKIREMISQVKEKIQGIEWDSLENINKSREVWEDGLRSKVREMIDKNEGGLGEVFNQFQSFEKEVIKRNLPL